MQDDSDVEEKKAKKKEEPEEESSEEDEAVAARKARAAKRAEKADKGDKKKKVSKKQEKLDRRAAEAAAAAAAEDGEEEAGEDTAKPAEAEAAAGSGEEEEEAPQAPSAPPAPEFKAHDSYPAMTEAVVVVYCPNCGFPPDFCIYGPTWDKCKPWCMENVPHYYPQLSNVSLEDAKKSADAAAEKAKVKQLPGGKSKRAASPAVTVRRLARSGRKCVTTVVGLETFGVKLEAAAKLFKKKFACGSAVVKGEMGLPDSVDIQGDFEEELIDLICSEWSDVPREKITVLADGTKKKGKR